jgi:hypothetical protein
MNDVVSLVPTYGLSAAPMTDVVEVPATRVLLRGVRYGLDHPYAALRTGVPMVRTTDLPAVPHRPAGSVIEFETG